jgi:hypothetical protein
MASIAKLGFDIKDVKVLLNSEPHADHGAGWRCSSRHPEPSYGPAKRAQTRSPAEAECATCHIGTL